MPKLLRSFPHSARLANATSTPATSNVEALAHGQIPFPWGVVWLNVMITLSLAFPFYTSYIALPRMMVALNANLDTIQWVLTAFTIAQTVMMPMVGWLSNRFGMRLFFSLCVLLTIVGSLGSGLAWNSGMLIACRILQGLGAGPIAPLSSVILFDAFPPGKRGVALGLSSATWAIGALLALPLGGYLIENLTWRAIFFCGMPCGLVGLGLSWRVLAPRSEAGEKRLDGWGVVTMTGFLVPLLFGLSQGQQYGWDALSIRLSFVIAVVSAVMFVFSALYRAAPLLDLRLFTNFPFAMACLVRFLNHVGFNAASLLLALFLQTTLDYSPLRVGLMVLPAALLVAPASLLIGRLTDRFDARLIFGSGLAVVTVAVYLLSTVNIWTPALWIVFLIMIQRLGSECVFAPLNYTGLQLLPAQSMRMGSGVLALMWSVGGAIGNAVTAVMLNQRRAVHSMAIGQDYAVHPGEREHTLRELQASLQQAGSGHAELDLTPEDILRHYLDQETSVAAFQDCFLLTTGVYLLALLPALLVRPRRRDV